jgi:hypothetical protein
MIMRSSKHGRRVLAAVACEQLVTVRESHFVMARSPHRFGARPYREGMEQRELQNVLVLIETAQRAGRSERELVALVERYFGEDANALLTPSRGRRLRRMRGVAELAELAGDEIDDLLADVDGVVADPLDAA